MKKIMILLIALVMVVPIFAQNGFDACTQATMDAQTDQNGYGWIAAGFCCGAWGWGASYIMDPEDPPATRLLGKDVNYVTLYTQCYQDQGKEIQTNSAMRGCLAGGVVRLASLAGG